MRKLSKQIFSVALALTVASTTLAPITANAQVTYNQSQTLYKTSKSATTSYRDISISCTKASETVKKATIKTSNKNIAELYYFGNYKSEDKTDYFDKNIKDYNYNYYNYRIGLKLNKTGKSVVSFKVGDKTYKSTITVKDYVNPVESMTITGVNGGKNIASKFKENANVNEMLKQNIKNGVVKVKAKKGWKVKSIHTSSSTTDLNYNLFSNKGVQSATLQLGDVKNTNGTSARVSVEFVDANGGTIQTYYYMNTNK